MTISNDIDRQKTAFMCRPVPKVFLIFVLALSMFGSPVAAVAAPSASCTMPGAAAGRAADHETMPCCSPDCLAQSLAAVLPSLAPGAVGLQLPQSVTREVVSYGVVLSAPETIDPPPRRLAD